MMGWHVPDGQLAFNLRQDVEVILGQGVRVSRALEQYAINAPLSSNAIRCAIQLRRDLSRRRLHCGDQQSGRLLTQLDGVGPVYAQQLAAAGIDTFDRIRDASPAALQNATKAGDKLKSGLCAVPKFRADVVGDGSQQLDVIVTQLQPDFTAASTGQARSSSSHYAHLIVGDATDGKLLLYRKVKVEAGHSEQRFGLGQTLIKPNKPCALCVEICLHV